MHKSSSVTGNINTITIGNIHRWDTRHQQTMLEPAPTQYNKSTHKPPGPKPGGGSPAAPRFRFPHALVASMGHRLLRSLSASRWISPRAVLTQPHFKIPEGSRQSGIQLNSITPAPL